MDGTIFDSEKVGFEHMCVVYPNINKSIYKELLKGNYFEGIKKHNLVRISETEEEQIKRRNDYAKLKSTCLPHPGMIDLLKELKDCGLILALNTSATDLTSGALLKANNLDKLFDFFGTKEVSQSKADKFQMIFEKFGLSSQEVLFVTDTVGDVLEAETVGVPTIGLTWGVHDENIFRERHFDNLTLVTSSIDELRNWILERC